MKQARQLAFGYSTKCNIRCGHCIASGQVRRDLKMDIDIAAETIPDLAGAGVSGISFTAGEPLLFPDEIGTLIEICRDRDIYTRVVTNGYWGNSEEGAQSVASALISGGLSQLRISCSRWHQEHISFNNIINCANACENTGLDYFVSFITDFSEQDSGLEQCLQDSRLKYFPEPVIYFGKAAGLVRENILTDFSPNTCSMNPYLTPELDMYACCDGAGRFPETDFLYLGNLRTSSADELFLRKEKNICYSLISNAGLSVIALRLGFKAGEIVRYRKCELCGIIFNSKENLRKVKKMASAYPKLWTR